MLHRKKNSNHFPFPVLCLVNDSTTMRRAKFEEENRLNKLSWEKASEEIMCFEGKTWILVDKTQHILNIKKLQKRLDAILVGSGITVLIRLHTIKVLISRNCFSAELFIYGDYTLENIVDMVNKQVDIYSINYTGVNKVICV